MTCQKCQGFMIEEYTGVDWARACYNCGRRDFPPLPVADVKDRDYFMSDIMLLKDIPARQAVKR